MTEAAAASEASTETSSDASTDAQITRDSVGATTQTADFTIPDNLKDAQWAQNIKSNDDMWSQMENMQGMMGKKVIPAADATDEQLNEFYSELRPKESSEYAFEKVEGVELDEAIEGKVKDIFHKHGLTAKQASSIHADYVAVLGEALSAAEAEKPTEEQLNAEFSENMKAAFGDKANQALKIANAEFAKGKPEALEQFKQLPNDVLIEVVRVINDNHNRFNKEDVSAEGSGDQSGSQSIEEARSELARLRASKEFKDFTHKDHEKTKSRIEELSNMVRNHKKKK